MIGKRGRAAVVVMGDLGRSPRMQYHALSLARQAGLEVDLVAFAGTEPHVELLQHLHVHLHLMRAPFPQGLPRILYLLLLPLKLVIQFMTLLWVLCVQISAPDFFLVQVMTPFHGSVLSKLLGGGHFQNPPSIPLLTVVRLACWIRKAAFVIDWHNFGYTILALSLGSSHPLVKIYFWYERGYGKMANGHLCVTKAMQHELAQNWGIRATVVYDRSPEFFHPISLHAKHELFCRLDTALTHPVGVRDCCGDGLSDVQAHTDSVNGESQLDHKAAGPSTRKLLTGHLPQAVSGSRDLGGEGKKIVEVPNYEVPYVCHTLFTSYTKGGDMDGAWKEIQEGDCYSYREGRPALIVSSTSWTADEDFGILLEAATMYDRRVAALLGEINADFSDRTVESYFNTGTQNPFPRLLFVVTGKGPMRAMYEERIRKLRLQRVAFRTMWLSAEDYPRLLGAADLGVCLHTSSSGLDLPMKVVDMFGCGLPVCAVSYSCIRELVKDQDNGLLFSSPSELANQLLDLFKGFPEACDLLATLRTGALASGSATRWDDEWREHVLPLLTKVAGGREQ